MIGETIGRYRIDAELGRGGMGIVYRATQLTLDRTVAIKMLSPQLADSGEYLARFRREAEVLARLQHENIVHIYDVEEMRGSHCIVMEYVAGPSLGQVMARRPVFPPEQVRELGIRVAAGLEAAHRKGVVHRDIKPDNILFTEDGRPRLTDFGIARIAGGDALARTRTGVLMGTPYYMSPEQAAGGDVSGASDLYSLGVLLYQMLSGSVPYDAPDPVALAIKHIHEPVPDLARTHPELPRDLLDVVARALRKDPRQRFGSAAEMEAALSATESVSPERSVLELDDGAASAVCAECGCELHSAFVTCPRCALAVGDRGAVGDSDSRTGSGPGPLWSAVTLPTWLPRTWDDWTRPRGRWQLPALVWAGTAVLCVGLVAGLLGGSGNDGALPGIAAPMSGPRPMSGPASTPTQATLPPLQVPILGPAPSVVPSGEPDPGPGPDPTTPAPDPTSPAPTPGSGREAIVVPADSFDIERARRELTEIIDRQRQATVTGDVDLFTRDLAPELATEVADDLVTLHREWSDLRSDIRNVSIRFDDATRARVDFHTVITGTPRGWDSEQLLQDTHVYWTVVRRDEVWLIIEAYSEAHGP